MKEAAKAEMAVIREFIEQRRADYLDGCENLDPLAIALLTETVAFIAALKGADQAALALSEQAKLISQVGGVAGHA